MSVRRTTRSTSPPPPPATPSSAASPGSTRRSRSRTLRTKRSCRGRGRASAPGRNSRRPTTSCCSAFGRRAVTAPSHPGDRDGAVRHEHGRRSRGLRDGSLHHHSRLCSLHEHGRDDGCLRLEPGVERDLACVERAGRTGLHGGAVGRVDVPQRRVRRRSRVRQLPSPPRRCERLDGARHERDQGHPQRVASGMGGSTS
jgi:hypothetical protein